MHGYREKVMIKGVLFDKDGTLLKFQELWMDAAKYVIWDFCFVNHLPISSELEEFFLKAMGVENNVIRQDGPLAYMTYEQIGEAVVNALKAVEYKDLSTKLQLDIYGRAAKISRELAGQQMKILFETVLEREELTCLPTCDLKRLFHRLKKQNIKIGLATADNRPVTEKCLKQLGIAEEFDFFGCNDGILKPKPEKDMFEAFCKECGLLPEEVAVVGDTANDMCFAKNAGGMAVGILCGLAKKEELEQLADVILDTPEGLAALLKAKNLSA